MKLNKITKIRKKKKLGNSEYSFVLLSISLSLTIVGILSGLLLHANTLIDKVKQNVELHVYLEIGLNESSRNKLQEELLNLPFVNRQTNAPVVYKSSQEISNDLINKKYLPKDFDDILGYNPIKPCFVLKIKSQFATQNKLSKIAKQLSDSVGVYEVDLSSERSKDLTAIVSNLNLISLILGLFTLLSVITISFLINNTIKLALFSQRFLIRSMQLVGAEKKFIKKPFLIKTTLQGIIGGAIAAMFTYGVIYFANQHVDDLANLLTMQDILLLLFSLLLLGGFIGFFSCWFALNRYLKLSLDELY